jgi:hypothetical protein
MAQEQDIELLIWASFANSAFEVAEQAIQKGWMTTEDCQSGDSQLLFFGIPGVTVLEALVRSIKCHAPRDTIELAVNRKIKLAQLPATHCDFANKLIYTRQILEETKLADESVETLDLLKRYILWHDDEEKRPNVVVKTLEIQRVANAIRATMLAATYLKVYKDHYAKTMEVLGAPPQPPEKVPVDCVWSSVCEQAFAVASAALKSNPPLLVLGDCLSANGIKLLVGMVLIQALDASLTLKKGIQTRAFQFVENKQEQCDLIVTIHNCPLEEIKTIEALEALKIAQKACNLRPNQLCYFWRCSCLDEPRATTFLTIRQFCAALNQFLNAALTPARGTQIADILKLVREMYVAEMDHV